MICQGPFLAASQHCQTVCLQKVWTYSTLYPCWRKMHHLFSQGSKKGHSQTSKTMISFCDWSSRDLFGPQHLFQFHTPYIRVFKRERLENMTVWEEILSKHKCEGLCGEEPLENDFCHKDKPFSLDCFWRTWSMKLMSRSITGKPGQRGSASQHLTLCRRRSKECLSPTASSCLGFEEHKQQWGYLRYYIFFSWSHHNTHFFFYHVFF